MVKRDGSGQDRIRFCAVDDHDIVLYGVEAMAHREPDLEFCGAAASAEEARGLVSRERPDVVLLDLRLGKEHSFGLCREITELSPGSRTMMFTAFGNEDLLDAALRAGAVGYLLKDASTAGLPEVLRIVQRDGSYFDPRIASSALLAPSDRTPLTSRELTVIRLIAEGRDNHAIAEEVHVSVHMVKVHVAGLLRRFGASNRAELVRILMERQLV